MQDKPNKTLEAADRTVPHSADVDYALALTVAHRRLTRTVLILLAILIATVELFLVAGLGPLVAKRFQRMIPAPKQPQSEDVRVVELPVTALSQLQVNHQQGSLRFMIGNEPCFFYIQGESDAARTIATSALLEDVKRATTVQIRHERYGIKRRAINFLLFFGPREVPETLKLQGEIGKLTPE